MEIETVLFRVDASPEIGGGHVVRCLSLAQEFKSRGIECHLLTGQETLELFPELYREFDVTAFLHLQDHLFTTYDLCIVDLPHLEETNEFLGKSLGKKALAFSDNPKGNILANYILDSNFERSLADYQGLLPKDCKAFLGSQYVPIRPSLLEQNKVKRDHVLVSVGYTDPAGLTVKFLQALAAVGNEYPVNVVIGYAPDVSEAVQEILARLDYRVTIYEQPSDLGAIYNQSMFALGAGGSSIWERAAMHIPSLAILVAENQRHLLEKMSETGAIYYIGEAAKIPDEQIENAVSFALSNQKKLDEMSDTAYRYCDGKGVVRIVDYLLK